MARSGGPGGTALSLNTLGKLTALQGDYGRAAALYKEGLLLSRDIGDRSLVAEEVEGLSWVAAARGRPCRAARLGGSAAALRAALGIPLPRDQQAGHDDAVHAIRTALGDEAFDAATLAGWHLALEQAIAEALAEVLDA